MRDLLMLLLTGAFFALCVAYVQWCDRIIGPDPAEPVFDLYRHQLQQGAQRLVDGLAMERWTPHDLRRTFASRCGNLHVAPHVIAKLLNHTIPGGDSLPIYLRSEWLEERKAAALALAAHVASVTKAGA